MYLDSVDLKCIFSMNLEKLFHMMQQYIVWKSFKHSNLDEIQQSFIINSKNCNTVISLKTIVALSLSTG